MDLLDGWSPGNHHFFEVVRTRRKVRSPQDSMPANGRGRRSKARSTESATENIPPARLAVWVRVKRCGKSAPRAEQFVRQGKPHAEQDQIGEEGRSAPFDFRVGRLSRSVMAGLEEWPPSGNGYRNRLIVQGVQYVWQLLCFTRSSGALLRRNNRVIRDPALVLAARQEEVAL